MEAILKSIRSLEYLSLVYYFAEVPRRWSRVADLVIDAAVEILGAKRTAIVICNRDLGPSPCKDAEEKRLLLEGDELRQLCRGNTKASLALVVENRKSRASGPKEFAWELGWEADPIASGFNFEPCLAMHFGLPFLSDEQVRLLSPWASAFTARLGECGELCHGLIDVGTLDDTGRGHIYESIEPMRVSFERRVRRLVWLRSGERRRHTLRGVFWGQLLSAPMVRRLGDPDRFVAEYGELEDPGDRNLIDILANGSMFIRLSSSITTVRRPFAELVPSTLERAAWLYERFTAAGIL